MRMNAFNYTNWATSSSAAASTTTATATTFAVEASFFGSLAISAATWLVVKTFLLEKLLFADRENELGSAVAAFQRLVFTFLLLFRGAFLVDLHWFFLLIRT